MSEHTYLTEYPNLAFERTTEGVLTCRMHTDGGPVRFSRRLHRDLSVVFGQVAQDQENRVLVLTGTGNEFLAGGDTNRAQESEAPEDWYPVFWEALKILQGLVDLPMPLVTAVNGPATFHSELALLGDITIASAAATFRDTPHLDLDLVPGDGVHLVWEELLGLNRARYAALTQQSIGAREALELGMVNEVVDQDQVLPHAHDLASQLAARPTLFLRYTPMVLRQRLSRRLTEATPMGLALEGLTKADKVHRRLTN